MKPIPFRLLSALSSLTNIEVDMNPGNDASPMSDALCDVIDCCAKLTGHNFDDFLDLVAAASGANVIEANQLHEQPEAMQ